MKPMHAQLGTVNRCPCCHSKYTRHGAFRLNTGKSAARFKQKRDLKRELSDMS